MPISLCQQRSPRRRIVGLSLCSMLTCVVCTLGYCADVVPGLEHRFASDAPTSDVVPNFQRHIVPMLGRLGCNGRSCHGSFQGQGGFRLSMFGYDFAVDHKSLLAGEPARINLKHPSDSLILDKPTSADEHGGGQRFVAGDNSMPKEASHGSPAYSDASAANAPKQMISRLSQELKMPMMAR